jgi:hypothetical protein
VLSVGLPLLACGVVVAIFFSRHVRKMEGRMQKNVMRRLSGVWVRDTSVELQTTAAGSDAVVVEAVEMQTTRPLSPSFNGTVVTATTLQAPSAFDAGGGSVVTAVEATVASVTPPAEKMAPETRVQV